MKKIQLLLIAIMMGIFAVSFTACTDNPIDETEQQSPENDDSTTGGEQPEQPEDPDQPGEPEGPEQPEDPGTTEPEIPQDPEPPVVDDGIVRILAIGNSFSQDAVEQYLYELFEADGQKVIIGNLYIGGCTLETHFKNMNSGEAKYAYRKVVDGVKTETSNVALLTGLKDEPWDYVSLQQASGSSGKYDTYTSYLPSLISYVQSNVTNQDLKLMFHQTWAYASSSNHGEFPKYDSNQMTMYQAIMDAVSNALSDNPSIAVLIPSGTAIQNARTSYLGDSFNRDGYHLETTYGRYTAACTWFESISGKSVVGNPYAPATIDDMKKLVAQNAAHLAVLSPWSVTEMTEFKTPVSSDTVFDSPVYIDFGGGNTTAPAPWVRVASHKIDAPIYLTDQEGGYSPLTISGLNGFTELYNGVGSEPSSSITLDGIEYPKSVWSDGLLIKGTKELGDVGPATVTLSGFDAQKQYNITILAVRYNGSADARITEYCLHGAQTSDIYQVYIGLKTFDSVESYESYQVKFTDVAPAEDGTFTLYLTGKDTGKAADGLLSAMVLYPAN